MQIQIHSKLSREDPLQEFVHTRLRHVLGRFSQRIERAAVTLEDLNGPRGGLDLECRITLQLRPSGEIHVSAVAASLGMALSEAAQRASRCTESRLQRRWMQRRKPQGAPTCSSAAI